MPTLQDRELELIEFWKKSRIFEKSVESRPVSKQFVFYDGPPFASGLPHYGHILGLTAKDVFPRYWTMKGYRVERRWGWDCHGLPIENIVEQKLGIKDKKEIEKMGISKFNEACRSQVLIFVKEWKKTVDRMGKWIEFDNAYKTMDNDYMETVWWIFKKLYDDGYIYQGKKVLLYCPHCQTPLANAEIAMDNSYRDITEKTATAKFQLKKEKNTYLLSWTSTPWTLIANVALAVNEALAYVKVKIGGEHYILVKDRLKDVVKEDCKVVEEFKGKKLLGWEYEPLYRIPSEKKGHYVINGGSEVSAEEGTGIVHMAAYGEFDYQMIRKYNLPLIQHLGTHGKLILGPEEWINTWFKDADKHVLADLENRSLLYAAENYTHPYPFCYRCSTPLFYNAVDSWFVDIQKVKKKLIECNKEIKWYPEHVKEGRFLNILETAPDWTISRNRFWATAIPIWKCQECNSIEVLGSVEELRKKAKEKIPKEVDLHKHIVDGIHLSCPKCKGTMNRVPEVMDCWFESGSMPYAAKHYPFKNQDWFKKNFPADFVSEYTSQVRAWFYYMHVLSVILFGKSPFKNVVVSGTILAADGSKMSKSKGNFPEPEKIFEQYGADALRFYFMASPLMRAEDLNFKEENVKEVYRKVLMILSNVKSFYELFGKDNKSLDKPSASHILDRWIVSRLQETVRAVTSALEEYNTNPACQAIACFVEDLSTWYVRRSRERFKSAIKHEQQEALHTLAYVLHILSKVMAPVTPFIAEDIHQMFSMAGTNVEKSVHLESWPKSDKSLLDAKLNQQMQQARDIVSKVLDQREKAKIPVRQPLASILIKGTSLSGEYLDIIKDEVNVKDVEARSGKEAGTREIQIILDTKITPELLQEGIAREMIRNVNGYRKELNLTIKDKVELYVEAEQMVKEAVMRFKEDLQKATQTKIISWKLQKDARSKEVKVQGKTAKIGLKVLS